MKPRIQNILALLALTLLATISLAGVKILDASPAHVTNRTPLSVYYGGRTLDQDGFLAFIKGVPKNALVLFDVEPLPANAPLIALFAEAKKLRPDVDIGVYKAIDWSVYTAELIGRAYRRGEDPWYLANLPRGLQEAESLRRTNNERRDLVAACDFVVLTVYPLADYTPDATGWLIDALADEGWRLGRGKPLMLLVSGVQDVDHTRQPYSDSMLGAFSSGVSRNGVKYLALWDGPDAKRVDFERVAKNVTKLTEAAKQ